MRAFIGLPLPAPVSADLERFLEPRADATPDWRWTPAENWHITLAFLGEVSERALTRLTDALGEAARRDGPVTLRLSGAGGFPSVGATKQLYQAVADPDGDLERLARHVRGAAQGAGCVLDADRFRAHVTVARTRQKIDATHLWRVLDTYVGPAWSADSFVLYRSELGQGRGGSPRYVPEETFPLTG